MRRIYGDFSGTRSKGWADVLAKHAIIPQQQFAYPRGYRVALLFWQDTDKSQKLAFCTPVRLDVDHAHPISLDVSRMTCICA